MWVVLTGTYVVGKIVYEKHEFNNEFEARAFMDSSPSPCQIYKVDFL